MSVTGFQVIPLSVLTSHWNVSAVESIVIVEVDSWQKATSSKGVFNSIGAPML